MNGYELKKFSLPSLFDVCLVHIWGEVRNEAIWSEMKVERKWLNWNANFQSEIEMIDFLKDFF